MLFSSTVNPIHGETEKAYKLRFQLSLSLTDVQEKDVWMPKSQVSIESRYGVFFVDIPDWLIDKNGLKDWQLCEPVQYKVIAVQRVKTITRGGHDLAQYSDYDLEVVPITHLSSAEFKGSRLQCENWVAENSHQYQYH